MSRRQYPAFAFLFAALFAAPARADSPVISCDPPLIPIAATICATPSLKSLDQAFSIALEKSVQHASRPDDDPDPDPGPIKTAYLEAWGRACPPASADAATCIADHYRRGLAQFQAAANSAAGICRKFAARYAIAIGKSNTGLPQSDDGLAYPLERMRDTQRSGVLIERRLQMSAVDALDLPDWARRAIAAFHITDKVGVALAESLRDENNSDYFPSALHLPGTAIFATATHHNTASCRIVTFRLRGAKKTPLPGPANWYNNDCANNLEFGAIDGVPVVFGSRGEREALQDRLIPEL